MEVEKLVLRNLSWVMLLVQCQYLLVSWCCILFLQHCLLHIYLVITSIFFNLWQRWVRKVIRFTAVPHYSRLQAKKGVIQTNRASSFAVGFYLLGVLSGVVWGLFCVWFWLCFFFLSRLAFSGFNLNFLQIGPKGIAFGKAGVYAVALSSSHFLLCLKGV